MNNRVINNAMWIIGCKIVQALLGLIVNILTARYLGPSNYGLINYAISLAAFLTPVMKLGLDSIAVQEIVNSKDEDEGAILGTIIFLTCIASIVSIVALAAFVMVANPGETTTHIVCYIYSLILFFYALELIQYWFQAKFLSKYTSITMLIAYVITTIYQIYLLASSKNIYWFAFVKTFDVIIVDIILFYLYRKIGSSRLSISFEHAKRMLNKSKHYILSNIMIVIFVQTDKVMLKMMIDDTATGYYSAAVNIAAITNFVFAAIIDSARPSILESKNISKTDFEGKMVKLYSVIIYFSLIQCVFITLFAGLIVRVLYGAEFYPSVTALQVLIWYTTFSYLGAVRDIWVLAEEKQKVLWKINLCGATANIILNVALIPKFGIVGAAAASLVTQFFTNVVTGYIFSSIRFNNELMIRGLNPLWGIDFVKNLLKQKKGK